MSTAKHAGLVLVATLLVATPLQAGGEIFGTIETVRGQVYTGPIRWDVNENFWDDSLDGSKYETVKREEDGYRFSIFGLKIGGGDNSIRHEFSIPFGHLAAIEPLGSNEATVTLKNGESFRVRGDGSSDIGRGIRKLEIEDAAEGRVELRWNAIKEVRFRSAPDGPGRDDQRLYGTVETRDGALTGYLVWDRDEAMLEDIVDGEDPDRKDRDVPFREIRAIERLRAGGSRLTLADGSTLELRGTNDIDNGHRGIRVMLAGVGAVDVDWDDVKRVDFTKAPASPGYAEFNGGRKISGTVFTADGRTFSGDILWDLDETYTWESLDGEVDRYDYSIPFANIAKIERDGSRSSRVSLRSGDVIVLSGSNDVDEDNKGIVVTTAGGRRTELEWMNVTRVELD